VSESYTLKTRPFIAPRSRNQLESKFMIVFLSRKAGSQLRFAHALQRQQQVQIQI